MAQETENGERKEVKRNERKEQKQQGERKEIRRQRTGTGFGASDCEL